MCSLRITSRCHVVGSSFAERRKPEKPPTARMSGREVFGSSNMTFKVMIRTHCQWRWTLDPAFVRKSQARFASLRWLGNWVKKRASFGSCHRMCRIAKAPKINMFSSSDEASQNLLNTFCLWIFYQIEPQPPENFHSKRKCDARDAWKLNTVCRRCDETFHARVCWAFPEAKARSSACFEREGGEPT